MVKIARIKQSIQNKTFCTDVKCHISNYISNSNLLIYSTDKSVIKLANEKKTYRKLYKKYKYVLDQGISDKKEPEQSNKIWILWLQGIENAPELVKACYNSVVHQFPDKEVILLDNNNLNDYVKFPDYIQKKFEEGRMGFAHYSDLIRAYLMCDYGGIWIDSTVLCTGRGLIDYISTLPMFCFKQLDLANCDQPAIIMSNWFLAGKSNQNIYLMTRNLLNEYWKDNDCIKNYFFFHIFMTMAARKYADEWKQIPCFNNHSPHVLYFELEGKYTEERWNQIKGFSDIHKLSHHLDFDKQGTMYEKVLNEYL